MDLDADPNPRVSQHLTRVGDKAHGLVARGSAGEGGAGLRFVMLDSDNGAVVEVDAVSGEVAKKWKVGRRGRGRSERGRKR